MVETWLEEPYRSYFYRREPALEGVDYGNINQQLTFKRLKNCKSFDWFMHHVARDVMTLYPAPPENFRWGAVRNAVLQFTLKQKPCTFGPDTVVFKTFKNILSRPDKRRAW